MAAVRPPGSAALGAIIFAVLVAAIVWALARAFPFELAAQALTAFDAQRARGGLADVGEWDRSLFVGVREDVDVVALEDDLFARHFFVRYSRQAALGRARNQRSARHPDHALARFGGHLRRCNGRAPRALGRALTRGRRAPRPALEAQTEAANENRSRSAVPRAHDSERSSRSRRPSSFIFSCRPLREILSRRAACVTLLEV